MLGHDGDTLSADAFRALVDLAMDLVLVADAETGRFLDGNEAACAALGYARAELMQLHVDDITAPPRGIPWRDRRSHLDRAGGSLRYPSTLRRADGGRFPADVAARRVRLGGRDYVVAMLRDTTEREQMEAALRASEARLREAQRIARVGSFEWTLASPTVAWSDEMHRITKTDPAHFATTNDSLFAMQSADEQQRVAALLEQAIASNAPAYEWESQLACHDGVVRDVHVRGEIVRSEDGAFMGVRGTMQDVTDQKCAARALADSEERYRRAQKLEAVGRLAGGIAHDFNNMLSPILGFASIIRRQLREGDPLKEPIEVIEEAGERAAALTKQLLALSSHQMVKAQPLDLNELVSRVERILQRVLGEDIELTAKLTSPLGRVVADPSQIEQVILNLAVNARDAMPEGGSLVIETANVTVGEARYVRLSVTDTGTGIDEATRARLFEPFFTTKEPGKGTGLGLATVYAIAKQWQGEVRVESTIGHGTRFDLDLPHHDGEESPVSLAEGALPTRPRPSEHVLVVEDDALVRRTTCGILREEGYQVAEASNGTDALAHIERVDIQLLVTDVVMPGMNGLELLTRARAQRPKLAALLLSGYSEDVLRGETATFLPKPFKSTELLQAARLALAKTSA